MELNSKQRRRLLNAKRRNRKKPSEQPRQSSSPPPIYGLAFPVEREDLRLHFVGEASKLGAEWMLVLHRDGPSEWLLSTVKLINDPSCPVDQLALGRQMLDELQRRWFEGNMQTVQSIDWPVVTGVFLPGLIGVVRPRK